MKAAIYNGIKNIDLRELDLPVCGDNDVVIKNLYACICGSDVAAYNHGGDDMGILKGYEFGHEMISVIAEKGKNVSDIEIGERVFPIPTHMHKEGVMRAATAGGFSEYVLIENFKLGISAVRVPEEISDRQAALIEPFLIGSNAILPLNAETGKKAIVLGAGPIGLCAAIVLKYRGCQVMVCDIVDSRLKVAKELGFDICNTINENYLEKCKTILGVSSGFTGEAIDADYYVDAAGNQTVVDLFFSGAKKCAVLSIVAVHHRPLTIDAVGLTYGGLQIVGPNGNYHSNLPIILDLLKSKQFDVEKMISHEFPHSKIVEAFEQASKADEALKVIIKY